jgi:predicted AlkP superfamily pyrophosphatase or phosphodiesterase
MRSRRLRLRWTIGAAAVLGGSIGSAVAPSRAADAAVRLVLVLTVDQMRPDYLERFGDLFTGGLRYLLDHGRVYREAYQDHAFTKTAAGHGTILSGLHPAHSGLIANDWYDREKKGSVYCTDDPRDPALGHSPRAFAGTMLGDWLREASSASKVIALSRKDRSAVLLGGQNPTGVFWFEPAQGEFMTSAYYRKALPDWVRESKAGRRADRYLGAVWDRLLPDAAAYRRSGPDDQAGEGDLGGRTFPHAFPGAKKPDAAFYNFLSNTPFMDELTLELAQKAVGAERLGQRGVTDLLALSLSSTDAVGHKFGPDSQEMQDMILRLDRYLGDFFRFVDGVIGMRNVLVVLTADHGTQPLPEVAARRGVWARRLVGEMANLLKGLEAELESKVGKGPWIVQNFFEGIYLDPDRIAASGRRPEEVERIAATFLRRSPIVADVFTRSELLKANPHQTPFTRQFVNAFHAKNSADLLVQLKVNHLVISTPTGTDHGTPYPYDSHVPLVFAGPGVQPAVVKPRARTVDIAPTLADLLGIAAPSNLDGKSLLAQAGPTAPSAGVHR